MGLRFQIPLLSSTTDRGLDYLSLECVCTSSRVCVGTYLLQGLGIQLKLLLQALVVDLRHDPQGPHVMQLRLKQLCEGGQGAVSLCSHCKPQWSIVMDRWIPLVNVADIRFQSDLVTVPRGLRAPKTDNTDPQHTAVNMEASDVSVYSQSY